MADKIKELLAVPNLPKEEQQLEALFSLGYKSIIRKGIVMWDKEMQPIEFTYSLRNYKSLADLAFRLRDEVEEFDWLCGIETVFQHIREAARSTCEIEHKWFVCEAQPIHWIIAALIAKEQVDAANDTM